MKRTHYLRNSIAGLFILFVVGFEMFVQSSAHSSANPCMYAQLVSIECVGCDATNCTFAFTIKVTNATNVASPAGVVVNTSQGQIDLTTNPPVAPNSTTTIKGTVKTIGPNSIKFTFSLPTSTCTIDFAIPLPPCVETQCAATIPDVSCVKDVNEKPIYNIRSNEWTGIQCQQVTLSIISSLGVVQPNSFPNVSSPGSVSFSLFGATSSDFTFAWNGCNQSCTSSTKLPHALPTSCGECLSLGKPKIGDCIGSVGKVCQYPFTLNLTNNTNDPGVVTISPSAGTVTPASFTVNPGVKTVDGTLSVICGTSPVTLLGVLTLAGFPAGMPPQTCKNTVDLVVPSPSVTATEDQTICKGGSTHVEVPANTPGSVMWYYAKAPFPTTRAPTGWTPLSVGTTWNTLALDETTWYQAVVTNAANCPAIVSNPVKVTVVDPKSGVITCDGKPCKTDICNTAVVNLTDSNATLSPGCTRQWERWDGNNWQPIPGATAATLSSQTLGPPSTCPFSVATFRVHYSCNPSCGSTDAEISFNVYKPTEPGSLTATKLDICEGDDDILNYTVSCGDVVLWERSTTGLTGSFVPIPGSNGATTWRTNRLYQDTWYRVKVKNGPFDDKDRECGVEYSAPVHITVKKKPTPSISPLGSVIFCAGVSKTLRAINPVGGTCQWFRSGLQIPGATGMSYSATASGNYYVVCRNSCGEGKSNITKVRVSRVVAVIRGASGVCPPASVTLKATASGGVAPYQFLWSTRETTPSIIVRPRVNTTYWVTVTDKYGCTWTERHPVTICR